MESIGVLGINVSTGYEGSIDCEAEFNNIGGIPLNSEILEGCGFKKRGDMYFLKIPVEGANDHEIFFFIPKRITQQQFGRYTVNDYHGSNNFFYLHQLQNLYFILTGSELTVNLYVESHPGN